MTTEETDPLPVGKFQNYSDDARPTSEAQSESEGRSPSATSVVPFIHPKRSVTCVFVTATLASVVGSSFQFGYNTSVINTPERTIKDWIGGILSSNQTDLDSKVTTIFSIAVSIWAIGGLVGGLIAGLLADRFGRKGSMLYNNIIAFIAAVLMGCSKPASSYILLIVGRFVSGINCGINTILPTMYLSEISSIAQRGALGVVHQFFVVVGILVSQVMGLPGIFGSSALWPLALAFTAVPAFFQPLLFFAVPESPRFLLINKGNTDGAQTALMRLRGAAYDSSELDQIKEEHEVEKRNPKISLKKIVKSPVLKYPFALMIILHLAQQLSGINGIFYYSTVLYKTVGLSPSNAVYGSIGTSGILVVMTLVSVPLMDRAGRRTLMLTGLGLMIFFEILLTVMLNVRVIWEGSKYFSIISIVSTVAAFAIGPGSIPWFIPAELFPQGARATAMSMGGAVNWLANFVVGVSFEHLKDAIDYYVFLPFIVLLVIFMTFLLIRLPETKNRSFEEINEIFEKRADNRRTS